MIIKNTNVDSNLRVSQYDARFCDVFDHELCLSALAGKPSDRAGKVIAFKRLHWKHGMHRLVREIGKTQSGELELQKIRNESKIVKNINGTRFT